MADEQEGQKQGRNLRKWILFVGIGVIVAVGVGGGAWWFLASGGSGEPVDPDAAEEQITRPGPEIFFRLDPPLLANIGSPGRVRYAQVGPVFSFTDKQVETQFVQATPVIRDRLLRVLNSYSYDLLMTPQGREDARMEMLAAVSKLMEERTAIPNPILSLYFDSFVVQ